MRALDLFAGAGGWDVAAKRLGIHSDGVEIMKEANLTRVAAGLETVGHDVWNYDLNVGRDYAGLIASPPLLAEAVLSAVVDNVRSVA